MESHDELILVEEPRVMVLANVEAGRLVCIGYDGLQLGPVFEDPLVPDPMRLAEFLAGIYIELGQTEFTIEDLALTDSGRGSASAYAMFSILRDNLPPQVLIKDNYRDEPTYRFGDFAVATQYSNMELCDLTVAGQALLQIGSKRFLLELQPEDKDSIMATRVFMALVQLQQQITEGDRFHRDKIITAAWEAMPIRERHLYATARHHNMHTAAATPSAVNYIAKTLNTVIKTFGVAKKASNTQDRYLITNLPLAVLLGDDVTADVRAGSQTVSKQELDWKIVDQPR